jgi:hypothetical protein
VEAFVPEPTVDVPGEPASPPALAAPPEPALLKPRLAPVERVTMTAIHHVDPLAVTARKRFFRRAVEESVVEVPDGPPPDRVLPSNLLSARPSPSRQPGPE